MIGVLFQILYFFLKLSDFFFFRDYFSKSRFLYFLQLLFKFFRLIIILNFIQLIIEFWYFRLFVLFRLYQLQNFIFLVRKFVIKLRNNLFEVFLFVFVFNARFVLIFKLNRSVPFKLQLCFSLNFDIKLLQVVLFYANVTKRPFRFEESWVYHLRFRSVCPRV